MKRHLILVGVSGSGKSTVGRLVAARLGESFADIDEIVASATGTSVADFFQREGEARFRQLERAAMDGALAAPAHVIAPGAGWAAEPGNLDAAMGRGGALVVYLRVSPEVAAARLVGDRTRPLLAGGNPVERIGEQLKAREMSYRRAQAEVDASGAAEEVAEQVARIARETLNR